MNRRGTWGRGERHGRGAHQNDKATGAAAAPVAIGSALETALFGCSGSAEGPPARGGRRAEQRDEDSEVGEVAAPKISGRGTSEACHPGQAAAATTRTHLIGSGLGTSDPARRRPDPAPVAGGGEGRDEVCGREEVGGGGEEIGGWAREGRAE